MMLKSKLSLGRPRAYTYLMSIRLSAILLTKLKVSSSIRFSSIFLSKTAPMAPKDFYLTKLAIITILFLNASRSMRDLVANVTFFFKLLFIVVIRSSSCFVRRISNSAAAKGSAQPTSLKNSIRGPNNYYFARSSGDFQNQYCEISSSDI